MPSSGNLEFFWINNCEMLLYRSQGWKKKRSENGFIMGSVNVSVLQPAAPFSCQNEDN